MSAGVGSGCDTGRSPVALTYFRGGRNPSTFRAVADLERMIGLRHASCSLGWCAHFEAIFEPCCKPGREDPDPRHGGDRRLGFARCGVVSGAGEFWRESRSSFESGFESGLESGLESGFQSEFQSNRANRFPRRSVRTCPMGNGSSRFGGQCDPRRRGRTGHTVRGRRLARCVGRKRSRRTATALATRCREARRVPRTRRDEPT